MKENTVTLTDSGTGDYRTDYPLDQFMDAWADSSYTMVATDISPDDMAFVPCDNLMMM
jgi:hypothetical protein